MAYQLRELVKVKVREYTYHTYQSFLNEYEDEHQQDEYYFTLDLYVDEPNLKLDSDLVEECVLAPNIANQYYKIEFRILTEIMRIILIIIHIYLI